MPSASASAEPWALTRTLLPRAAAPAAARTFRRRLRLRTLRRRTGGFDPDVRRRRRRRTLRRRPLRDAPAPDAPAPIKAYSVNWDAIAQCESGGNWGISTGNGFSGGLQFTSEHLALQRRLGFPNGASREEQIRVAENVLHSQGIGAWPVCGRRG